MMKSGIYDLSNAEYHANKTHISKSGLDLFHKSPADFLARKPPTYSQQKNFDRGGAFHVRTLEPNLYDDQFVVAPAINKNRNDYKEWAKEQGDKTIISMEDHEMICRMAQAVRKHPRASKFIQGEIEKSIFTECPETGVKVKVRPDVANLDLEVIVDLKSAADAREEAFSKSAANFRYYVQDPFYRRHAEIEYKQKFKAMVFVVVEKSLAANVAIYTLNEEAIDLGIKGYLNDLRYYAWCKENKEWPGYSPDVQEIGLPGWFTYRNK
jgi:uncharacterized Zn-finger protein